MKITRQLIESLRTEAGGYTCATFEALGVGCPPKSGWLHRLIGTEITEREYRAAARGRYITKKPEIK